MSRLCARQCREEQPFPCPNCWVLSRWAAWWSWGLDRWAAWRCWVLTHWASGVSLLVSCCCWVWVGVGGYLAWLLPSVAEIQSLHYAAALALGSSAAHPPTPHFIVVLVDEAWSERTVPLAGRLAQAGGVN